MALAAACQLFDVSQKHAQDGAVRKREQQRVRIRLPVGGCWDDAWEVSQHPVPPPAPLEPGGNLSHWAWQVSLRTPALACQICLHVEVDGGVHVFEPDGRMTDPAKVVDGSELELCFKLDGASAKRPAVRYTVCRTTTLQPSGVVVDESQDSVPLVLLPKPTSPNSKHHKASRRHDMTPRSGRTCGRHAVTAPPAPSGPVVVPSPIACAAPLLPALPEAPMSAAEVSQALPALPYPSVQGGLFPQELEQFCAELEAASNLFSPSNWLLIPEI